VRRFSLVWGRGKEGGKKKRERALPSVFLKDGLFIGDEGYLCSKIDVQAERKKKWGKVEW